jgi:hypothetical protein
LVHSELVEDHNNGGGHDNRTHKDSQGYHVALVLPIGNFAGRTAAAKEGMRIPFAAVAARSCHRLEHWLILAAKQLAEIDPRHYIYSPWDSHRYYFHSFRNELRSDVALLSRETRSNACSRANFIFLEF